jgi:hypothetical protein
MADSLGGLRWAPYLNHIDLPAQRFFKIEDEPAEVEDGPARLQLDEKVDIAVRPSISSGHGPEHPDMACAVPRRNSEKLLSAGAEVGEPQRRQRLANGDSGPGTDLELDPEGVREPGQGRDARGDLAALQPSDRRLGRAKPGGKPGLRQARGPAGRGKCATQGFVGARTPSNPWL